MSLVQRVTSIEGTDREPPQLDGLFAYGQQNGYGTVSQSPSLRHVPSHQRSLRHVLSYDALANPDEPSQATNPTGGVTQYKISTIRRVAQVCFTILACWLASGILFGFAALKPVLIDQGMYRESCTAREIQDDVELCYKQDLRYLDPYRVYLSCGVAKICQVESLLRCSVYYIQHFNAASGHHT